MTPVWLGLFWFVHPRSSFRALLCRDPCQPAALGLRRQAAGGWPHSLRLQRRAGDFALDTMPSCVYDAIDTEYIVKNGKRQQQEHALAPSLPCCRFHLACIFRLFGRCSFGKHPYIRAHEKRKRQNDERRSQPSRRAVVGPQPLCHRLSVLPRRISRVGGSVLSRVVCGAHGAPIFLSFVSRGQGRPGRFFACVRLFFSTDCQVLNRIFIC